MSDSEIFPRWTCTDCGRSIASETIHRCPVLAAKMGVTAVFKAVQTIPESE